MAPPKPNPQPAVPTVAPFADSGLRVPTNKGQRERRVVVANGFIDLVTPIVGPEAAAHEIIGI